MKRNVWVLAFSLITAGLALADAGWIEVHPSTSKAGPLYSVVDHPSVALDSEVLVFDVERDEWRAEFIFSNDGNAETLLAGFPVLLRLPLLRRGNGWAEFVADESFGPTVLKELFGAAAVVKLDQAGEDLVGEKFAPAEIELFGSHFLRVSGPIVPKRIERKGAVFAPKGYSLTQDGREIPVSSVVLDSAPGNDWLDITLHALHELRFPARQQSRLTAVYLASSRFKSSGGNRGGTDWHASTYMLGTGGTWKGPIGRFNFIIAGREGMNTVKMSHPSAVGLVGKYSGGLRSYDIFRAENFEPARDAEISLSFQTPHGKEVPAYLGPLPPLPGNKIIEWGRRLDKPKAPAQADLVTVLGASSWLKDTADVVVAGGWIKAADFGPLALFDGYPSTAWCEGKADDGVGEWVELSIAAEAVGLSIWNGFTYIPYDSADEVGAAVEALAENDLHYTDQGRKAEKDFKSGGGDWDAAVGAVPGELHKKLTGNLEVFQRNNRVRQLEISNLESGLKYQVDLADRRGRQFFAELSLPAGSYRLKILSIHKGSKYRDTLLGELFFHPMERSIQTLMQEDQLFNLVFGALRKRK